MTTDLRICKITIMVINPDKGPLEVVFKMDLTDFDHQRAKVIDSDVNGLLVFDGVIIGTCRITS